MIEVDYDTAVGWLQVPTASVAPGDVLRILPGERMPVDGLVLAGRSVADEAMLTGEAALVPKGPGDQACATLPHQPCVDRQLQPDLLGELGQSQREYD